MASTQNAASLQADPVGLATTGFRSEATQLDALARQHAATLAFARLANTRPNLSALLRDAVALVAKILDAELCGVGEVVAGGTELLLKIAATNRQGDPADATTYRIALRAEDSMAAYALKVVSPVATSDLPAEKRYADLFLSQLGVVSALTVPLYEADQPFGILGVYSQQERGFTLEEIGFAETVAHVLICSVARENAEQTLRQHRALVSTVLEMIGQWVLVLDAHGRVVHVNPACRQITGLSAESVRGKSFFDVFALPEEAELLRAVLSRTDGSSTGQFESCVIAADASRRRVCWSFQVIHDERDAFRSIVLTGAEEASGVEPADESAQTPAEGPNVVSEEPRPDRHAQGPRGDPAAASADQTSGPASSTGQTAPAATDPASNQSSAPQEKRRSSRRAFHCLQSIAPVYGGYMPSAKQFFEVPCEDISLGGISFYLDDPPDFEDIVVALGQAPALKYYSARVVRVLERVRDERKVYLVGCRLGGRLYL